METTKISAESVTNMKTADLIKFAKEFADSGESTYTPIEYAEINKVLLARMADKLKWEALPNDYYKGSHSDYCVNEGDFLADKISDFVNGKCYGSNAEHLLHRVTHLEHRYLQQSWFKIVMRMIDEWAKNFDEYRYDERNEYACKMSKYIKEKIDEYEY